MAAGALYFLGLGGAPAESTNLPPKPQDLTGMSLEDLLHEEIIPVNVLGSHTHLKHEIMVGRWTTTSRAAGSCLPTKCSRATP